MLNYCKAVGLVSGIYIPSSKKDYLGEVVLQDEPSKIALSLSRIVKKTVTANKVNRFLIYPRTSKESGKITKAMAIYGGSDFTSNQGLLENQFILRGFIEQAYENRLLMTIYRNSESKASFSITVWTEDAIKARIGELWEIKAVLSQLKLEATESSLIQKAVPTKRQFSVNPSIKTAKH